ncbi:MAG: hypothetical protein Q9227_001375 [Pyrenula ochraceoflavens]
MGLANGARIRYLSIRVEGFWTPVHPDAQNLALKIPEIMPNLRFLGFWAECFPNYVSDSLVADLMSLGAHLVLSPTQARLKRLFLFHDKNGEALGDQGFIIVRARCKVVVNAVANGQKVSEEDIELDPRAIAQHTFLERNGYEYTTNYPEQMLDYFSLHKKHAIEARAGELCDDS